MTVGPEDFFKRIEESGLLNDSIVEQKDRLRAVSSGEEAAADLVSQKLLTAYQSEVLLSGEDVPLVLGDYVVTESIGRGGMGYVLKARHRRMKRTVAIKFLLKSLTDSEDLRRRFEREVEAAAQLDHQNIVTAYDAGVHEGSHYLVMQYVDGEDLSQIVKSSGPMEIPDAVDVIRQAALGLGYAHDRGIIHRDIKPGNLLLDSEGVVRILDMGLARMTPSPGDELEGGANADLTNTGSVMGTIDYMAPEQALDAKSVDHRADIYALGCTLYFLLTSNPPFRNETVMRRLLAHREQPAPRISEYRPGAPPELDDIFATMMAKSPDDRFPSMKHLIAALDSLGLNDSEDAQMATLDVPDDGTGGFVGLPGYDASANSESADLPPTSSQSGEEPSPGVSRSLPVSDVTILETPSNVSALTAFDDAEAASQAGAFDTDFTGVGETIIGGSRSVAGVAAARTASPPLPWKLIASVGLAVVALIAFLMTRPDPAAEHEEPSKSAAVATAPQNDTPSDDPQRPDRPETQSPDRRAAEGVLKLGGSVWVGSNFQQIVDPADLPTGHFVVTKIDLSNKKNIEDKFLDNFRGLADLQILILTETSITDRGLANLTNEGRQPLPSLQRLHLDDTKISQDGLRFLSGSRDLSELWLEGTVITDGAVLDQFPKLKNLGLGHTSLTTDELQEIIARFPQLNLLTIDGLHLTETMARTLADLPELRDLYLRKLTSDFEPDHLARLPLLTELYVNSDDSTVFDDDFWKVVAGLHQLQTLMCQGVTDQALAKSRPMAQTEQLIVISKVVTGESLAKTMSKFPNVSSLMVKYSDWTDNNVQQLRSLKSLRKIDLTGNKASAEAIKALSAALPDCRIISDHGTFGPAATSLPPDRRGAAWVLSVGGSISIDTPDGTRLDIKELKDLPHGAFVVKKVSIQNRPQVMDDGLANLRGCSQLAAIYAYDTAITDQGLANLTDEGSQPLENLTSLFIARTKVSDTGLRYLADSKDLLYLDIQSNPISDGSLLGNFRQLSTLDIVRTKISAEELSILQGLPLLRKLSVDGRQLEGVGSQYVSSLNKLSELTVQYPRPGFDGAVLRKLEELTRLELLELSDGQLSDVLWSAVGSVPKLESLNLDGDGVTEAAIGKMPSLPELKVLTLKNGEKNVSGETIAAAVRRAPALKELVVSHNELNDGDTKSLESLTQLTRLVLSNNDITAAGIESVHKRLTNCRIESDHGVFAPSLAAMSPDRRAAEAALKLGGSVVVRDAAGSIVSIAEPGEFPAGALVVTEIDLSEKRNIEDEFLANFRGLADLQSLILTETSITDRGLANLTDEGRQPLPSLQRLDLDGTKISQTGLQFLSGSHALWELRLNGTSVEKSSVLSQFPNLTVFDIADTSLTSDDLQIIAEFSNLERLTMDASRLTETMTRTVSDLAKLRALKLRNLPSDFEPGHLARFPLLSELYVDTDDSAVFDDDFWNAVAGLQELHILMCKGVTDESLAKAHSTPQVEVLIVMSRVVTAEAFVKSMSNFPNVKSLTVNYSDWTDHDVKQLHGLKSLGKIDLTKNSASVEAIKALSAALPKCQIISDHGTFEPAKTK